MNRSLRQLLAVAALAAGLPAVATTASTDYTDLWYVGDTESGWGVNVIQQGDIVFATLFVYGQDNTPRWYVADAAASVASPPGQNRFTGPLFSTVGTWFGAPWGGPSQNTRVGNITFSFDSPTTGTVTYTVNNVPVSKAIVRQTWRGNPLTGSYVGGLSARGFNCRGVSDGPILVHGELTVNHVNILNPTFQVDYASGGGQVGRCTFTGGYAQEGRLGRVSNGTWACSIPGVSNPPSGTFSLTQIEGNTKGFTARFAGSDQTCSYEGYFGGIVRMF